MGTGISTASCRTPDRDSHPPSPGGVGRGCSTGSLTQLGGHRFQAKPGPAYWAPSPTLALPGAPGGEGTGRAGGAEEDNPARGLRPSRGPIATPHAPQGCTVFLPESPWYPCCLQHSASMARTPARSRPGRGDPKQSIRGSGASGSGCRAGSRGIPGLEAAEGVGAAVTSGGRKLGCGLGGGCLRQEGPLGQDRVG